LWSISALKMKSFPPLGGSSWSLMYSQLWPSLFCSPLPSSTTQISLLSSSRVNKNVFVSYHSFMKHSSVSGLLLFNWPAALEGHAFSEFLALLHCPFWNGFLGLL
jgi:hypothetical protein